MSFSFVPKYSFRDITDVSTGFLNKLGVRFLMLDLDNTIAAYCEQSPSVDIMRWAAEIIKCGVELYIVSNSAREGRVRAFAEALGIGVIMCARKPSPRGVIKAIENQGFNVSESALVGDQVFTDTLAANRAGVISIIVRPRRFTNVFLALRYSLETPFRVICKNKLHTG